MNTSRNEISIDGLLDSRRI